MSVPPQAAAQPLPDEERFATGRDFAEQRGSIPLDEFREEFDLYIGLIERFRGIGPDTHILEVGAGTGWFEVLCAKRGIRCTGLELSPINLEVAARIAEREGVEVDLQRANIEEADLGHERYDAIIAASVFEHVEHYGRGLARIYDALKPGGLFYFFSTNKFSPRSGEYPQFPLYGWWPYSIRRRIRVARQGPGIVTSSGIDFNQFTYWGLRRHFESLGFSRVMDRFEVADPARLSPQKGLALRVIRATPPLLELARTFASGTMFVCVK